jgi:hypothetical protein
MISDAKNIFCWNNIKPKINTVIVIQICITMNIAKHSLIKVTKSLILRNAAESNLVIRHSTAAKSCCCGFVVKMPRSLVKISLKETDF